MNVYYPNKALSVTGLTNYLRVLLESDPQLQNIWVIGEVSSVHYHPSAIFFTLSDPNKEASIRCVIWDSRRSTLTQEPKQGEKLFVVGNITLYQKRGEYKINVFQVLRAGEGLQEMRYQQLKSRLEAEGLFSPERKRVLPSHPQTIAVVTSSVAAAWGDIQRTFQQHYPGLKILFSPAVVQGEKAPDSIVAAIHRVNLDGRAEVLILARGGGAVEDLSCFNDERVVKAIACSNIPVITGIGHQKDESLADLVADKCAHTPTAAAEIAVASYYQILEEHQQRINRLIQAFQDRITTESEYLKHLKERLKNISSYSKSISQATARCEMLKEKLAALNPSSVLQRGYALVKKDPNFLINSTLNLQKDQELVVILAQGKLKVKIVEVLE